MHIFNTVGQLESVFNSAIIESVGTDFLEIFVEREPGDIGLVVECHIANGFNILTQCHCERIRHRFVNHLTIDFGHGISL